MLFTDNPLLGVGIGNSPEYYPRNSVAIGVAPSQDPIQVHDIFLEVAAETGILGVLALGVLMWLTVENLYRARRAFLDAGLPTDAHLVGAFALGLFAFTVCLLFLPGAYPYFRLALFGLAAAMPVVAQRQQAKRERTSQEVSSSLNTVVA